MSDSFDSVPSDYRQVIRQHSRSFSFAARLLPNPVRADVQKLYAWCRWCDEAVDDAATAAVAGQRLALLREDISRIYAGEPPVHQASNWLAELVHDHAIPIEYPLGLLDGMEMDLGSVSIGTEEELMLYCKRAAGTVGLMLCRLFGVTGADALRSAEALGIAMQLTNIARDVREDWLVGRCYLPSIWFKTRPNANSMLTNQQVQAAVRSGLNLADKYYQEGISGLKYLPPGCRFSISAAANIYREIGQVIRRRNFRVMDGRTSVSLPRKLFLVLAEIPRGPDPFSHSRLSHLTSETSLIHLFLSTGDRQMKNNASYIATLGISLTSIVAAALFVIVALNPKDAESYGYLPWLYFGGCALTAIITQFLLIRLESPSKLVPEPVRMETRQNQST